MDGVLDKNTTLHRTQRWMTARGGDMASTVSHAGEPTLQERSYPSKGSRDAKEKEDRLGIPDLSEAGRAVRSSGPGQEVTRR